MNDLVFSLGMQMLAAGPPLLAYLVGMFLALSFWRRCPRPALLTFLAMMLLATMSVGGACLSAYVVYSMGAGTGRSLDTIDRLYRILVLVEGVVHAAAIGLLLGAVFVGRKGLQQPGPTPALPAVPTSEGHGITPSPAWPAAPQ